MDTLMQLTRFQDRLTYLYLEKGHIEQDSKSVAYVNENQRVAIPAADLSLLMLGPGTTITHQAVCNLADCNCTVVWCGEEGVRFYSYGRGGTHFSANMLLQMKLACDPRSCREVVRKMYQMRFGETIEFGTPIQTIRGKEGYRVREAYRKAGETFGVKWEGRNYDPNNWDAGDPLNKALSSASACLNGLVQAGIVSTGYSPAIGFIHTGKMLSFVYDVADFYKVAWIVPLVFELVSKSDQNVERRARLACRDLFQKERLLERLLPDIRRVLDDSGDTGKGASQSEGRSESLDAGTEGRNIPRPYDSEDT